MKYKKYCCNINRKSSFLQHDVRLSESRDWLYSDSNPSVTQVSFYPCCSPKVKERQHDIWVTRGNLNAPINVRFLSALL